MSEVFDRKTHGVLKLTLFAAHYSWSFVPIAGKSEVAGYSGNAPCPIAVINPITVIQLLNHRNVERAARVREAMMNTQKLDNASLQAAFEGQ